MKRTLLLFLLLIWVQITAFSQGPYTINSSAGPNGTISPLGSVLVTAGTDQLFTITPSVGYYIATVFVDGIPQISDPSAYTFTNVTGAHTISATFHLLHLALNKPSYAQSSEIGRGASFANDADASNESRWASTGNNPQWWKVDLQQICDITSMAIGNYFDGSRFYHYNIEVSNDDITYTTYVTKSDDSPVLEDGDLFNITATARYIRVNIIYNSSGPAAQICDFRVYGVPSPATFNITSSAGAGGTINPTGVITVNNGADKTFAITPNSGFKVSDVLVDGGSVGAVSSYTFTNVVSVHTISAAFLPVNTITASAGTGGTITPQGAVLLDNGANQTFTIAPKTGFQIAGVIVDGIPQGAIPSYSFTNVVANHTISVTFTVAPHLALGKLSYAQTSETGRGPGFANDGDASNESRWASQDPNPQWWKVDLDGIFNVTSIVIRNYADGTRYYQYNIEGSTDDITYTKIAEKTSINIAADDGDTYSLNVLVKYIRVNILYNSAGPAAQICDFRVYGNPTLTISNVTANNKVYNGTTLAALNTGSASLVGVSGSDNVTLVSSGAVGNFADKDAGSGKVVTISGFTITGPDAGKYTLIQPSTTANITALPVTVNATAGQSKIFSATDPTPFAYTLTPSLIGGDVVTGLMSRAAGENAGAYAFTLGTLTAGLNYTLSVAATPTFIITPKAIVVTADAGQTKIYGQSDPVFTFTNTPALETGDSFTGALGRTAGVNTGTYAFTLGTLSAGSNYTLSVAATPGFSIAQKAIVVTADAGQTKVYGQPDPVFTYSNSPALESGDSFTGAMGRAAGVSTGTYAFTLGTLSAGSNYALSVAATPTFNITLKSLNITGINAVSKIYDSNTTALLSGTPALAGIVSGDVVTIGGTPIATFISSGAANNVIVNVTGYTITGPQAANYSLTQPSGLTANITARQLTIGGTFLANNKVYDGTTEATIKTNNLTLLTITGIDDVNLVATAAFSDVTVGTGKPVSLMGSSLSGTAASNYTLSLIGAPTALADISEFGLTVAGVTANNKVYDGTTIATLNTGGTTLLGILGTDVVNLVSTAATGTFVNKDVGIGKVVTTNGFALTGPDAGKYSLIQPTTTADITTTGLTITGAKADNKVYDGTTSATLNTGSAVLEGIFGVDNVSLNFSGITGIFSDKNVGTGKTVTTSGFNLTGIDAANYTLTQPSLTADITQANLTVSRATVNSKVYDGTTVAALNTLSAELAGIFGTDVVTLVTTGASGIFADKNAGISKSVSATGFTLGGTDAVNYILIQPSLTGDISPKTLTITANDSSKSYGTDLVLNGTEIAVVGLVAGDAVPSFTLISEGISALANTGTYPVSVSAGSDNNYSFIYVDGILTVNKATLTATADDKSKMYGSSNPSFTISYSGFKNGESESVLDSPPVASTLAIVSSNTGIYPVTISGGTDNNYELTLVEGSLEVQKANLTISAENKAKTYKQTNPAFSVRYSGFVLGQDQSVLDILPVPETTATINSDAGDYDINVSGAADANYSFIYNKGTLTINKADQNIIFSDIPAGLRMTQEYELNAVASSGLPVSFEVSDQNIGILNSNILTVKGDGQLTITALQEGDHNWNQAPGVTQTIVTLPTFDNIKSLFTPNSDGVNDYWHIPDLLSYGNVQVTVYNRFGQTVYKSDSYKNDWDGTWNGNPLPSASYYYIIKSSEKGLIKGVVNIVR